jgi:hypothetical protein
MLEYQGAITTLQSKFELKTDVFLLRVSSKTDMEEAE